MLLRISESDYETIEQAPSSPEALVSTGREQPPVGHAIQLSVEHELRDYLADNLELIEPGLAPLDPETYVEYDTGEVGRIDILARDDQNQIVVIELKKGRADDEVVCSGSA